MRGLILVLTLLSVLPSSRRLSAQAAKPDSFRIRALAILRSVPLIDGHNDIPDAIRERGGLDSVDSSASQPKLMTDIPRMRAGGMGGQFWAAYVPVGTIHGEGPHPAVYALEQIDLVRRLCHRYPQALAMAATAADVERNFRAGKISCLIGIEGGHAIENSLGALRMFYALGVRYVTLTHWETIDWADAATDSAKHGGLTPFGEDVVREMNRLGMLVDLSHVSDSTMIDALRVSRAPVIFSHSSARALDSHVRNVPDSILRLLARNGGVVMTNFAPDYVSEALRAYGDTISQGIARLRAAGLDSTAIRDSVRVARPRPHGDARSGGRPHGAPAAGGRRGPRRARLGFRRDLECAGGARGRVEVPRSHRGAAAARVDGGGRPEGGGAEYPQGDARRRGGRHTDAGDHQIAHITSSLRQEV